jgi:hypothetical protein
MLKTRQKMQLDALGIAIQERGDLLPKQGGKPEQRE